MRRRPRRTGLRFAQVAALALVGAPIWWGCWWSQNSLARQPGDIGRREQRSRVRRLYLYAILLLAAIAFFFGAGMSILGLVTGRGLATAADVGADRSRGVCLPRRASVGAARR